MEEREDRRRTSGRRRKHSRWRGPMCCAARPLPVLLRVYRVGHAFVYQGVVCPSCSPAITRPTNLVRLIPAVDGAELRVHRCDVPHMSPRHMPASARTRSEAPIWPAPTGRDRSCSGNPLDAGGASPTLGCELRRWHVAMVLWTDSEGEERPVGRWRRPPARWRRHWAGRARSSSPTAGAVCVGMVDDGRASPDHRPGSIAGAAAPAGWRERGAGRAG